MITKIYIISFSVFLGLMLAAFLMMLSYFMFFSTENGKKKMKEKIRSNEVVAGILASREMIGTVSDELSNAFDFLVAQNNTRKIDFGEFKKTLVDGITRINFTKLSDCESIKKIKGILKEISDAPKIRYNNSFSTLDIIESLIIKHKDSQDIVLYKDIEILFSWMTEKFPDFKKITTIGDNEFHREPTSQQNILEFLVSYVDKLEEKSRVFQDGRRQAEIKRVTKGLEGITQPTEKKNFLKSKVYLSSDTSANSIQMDGLGIFFEIILKKFARLFMSIITFGRYQKLNFFFKPEKYRQSDESSLYETDEIYKNDGISRNHKKGITLHNGGHATTLIQFKLSDGIHVDDELRVIVDPVFHHLNPLMYRSQTNSGEGFNETKVWDDLGLDVIMISHNHRDHFDEKSLKIFARMKIKPIIVVPIGLKSKVLKIVKDFGFTENRIVELGWGQDVVLNKDQDAEFLISAVPADHWSGSNGLDTNHSVANGYLVTSSGSSEMVYCAGDTAKLSKTKFDDLIKVIDSKNSGILPRITNLVPAGPNYNRNQMKSTHQSVIESVDATLRLVLTLMKLETNSQVNLLDFFKNVIKTPVIFSHHNKYELGPDRYNEGLNVLKKLEYSIHDIIVSSIPVMTFDNMIERLVSENALSRDKFVYEGARDLFRYLKSEFPEEEESTILFLLQAYVKICIENSFLKVGEKANCDEMMEKIDEQFKNSNTGRLFNLNLPNPMVDGVLQIGDVSIMNASC